MVGCFGEYISGQGTQQLLVTSSCLEKGGQAGIVEVHGDC